MEYPIRIQWEDVDYASVIFWPRYFVFVERAISDWLLSKGLSWTEFLGRRQFAFPIASVAADFYKPVRLQDDLTLELGVCDLTAQGCCFVFNLKRRSEESDDLVASGYIQRRFVDLARFLPSKLPDDLMSVFAAMQDESRDVRCVLRTNTQPSMTLPRNSGSPGK